MFNIYRIDNRIKWKIYPPLNILYCLLLLVGFLLYLYDVYGEIEKYIVYGIIIILFSKLYYYLLK